jgi:integrase/ribosomal protein L40E
MESIDYNAKRLEKDLERIRKSEISEENKALILKFHEYSVANGLSKAGLRNQLWCLYCLAKLLDKPFTQLTKEDVIKLVSQIESKYKSEKTKVALKAKLKQFFKWLKNSDGWPEEVAWIKARIKECNKKLPEELLTKEEVERLASTTENVRDKALILILYESGCRIGELLSMKIKDIQFDEYGCILMVKGKTGMRRVRIIEYTKALTDWLDKHPLKDDPEAYVWISLSNNSKYKPISYIGIETLLKKLKIKSGISKAVNPHAFRHARATHLAKYLPEAIMKEYFGWVQDSKMASVYYHLAGKDVDEALLKMHGLKPKEEKELKPISIKVCEKCQQVNSILAQFCRNCGMPLDLKTALMYDETRRSFDEFIFEMLKRLAEKDPKIKKEFVQLIKEKGIENIFVSHS